MPPRKCCGLATRSSVAAGADLSKKRRRRRCSRWATRISGKLAKRLPESYWIAEPVEVIAANLIHIKKSSGAPLTIAAVPDDDRGATLVMVLAADHPGLFYAIAGGIHLAGGNIIDARIHTTRDGLALDNFLVGSARPPVAEAEQIVRLTARSRTRSPTGINCCPSSRRGRCRGPAPETLSHRAQCLHRQQGFQPVAVIEVNAQDRRRCGASSPMRSSSRR